MQRQIRIEIGGKLQTVTLPLIIGDPRLRTIHDEHAGTFVPWENCGLRTAFVLTTEAASGAGDLVIGRKTSSDWIAMLPDGNAGYMVVKKNGERIKFEEFRLFTFQLRPPDDDAATFSFTISHNDK